MPYTNHCQQLFLKNQNIPHFSERIGRGENQKHDVHKVNALILKRMELT